MKVLHIITGLKIGGAEMMLFKLLSELNQEQYISEVICLSANGEIGERIEDLGIKVHALNLRGGIPSPSGILKMSGIIKEFQPDVVQTWLNHADLIGGFTAKFTSSAKIVWNIRAGDLVWKNNKWHTYLAAKICAWTSPWMVDTILTNSYEAQRTHTAAGYSGKKFKVIPNGFDLEQFKPNQEAKEKIRAEIGLPESAIVLTTAGRFHYQKDYKTFIKTAAMLAKKYKNLHFVMFGADVDSKNELLMSWINETTIQDRIHLMGTRRDVNNMLAACDIFMSSSSCGEAFGNIIGEAMACGVPCVVTDVGDSAIIVDDTGAVSAPSNPELLAKAADSLLQLSDEQRKELGEYARKRMVEHYSIEVIAQAYGNFYQQIHSKN